MYNALHPRDNIHRWYVSRKEGGRGLASTVKNVDILRRRLEENIKNKKKLLIIATKNNKTTQLSTTTIKYIGEKKGIVWIFQAWNKRDLTREDLDMAKKGKS